MDERVLISDDALWERLKELASRAKQPVDELVQEALVEYVERHAGSAHTRELPDFVGMLRSKVSDTSERAEVILAEELVRYVEDETQE